MVYTITSYGETERVKVFRTHYTSNDKLAVVVKCENGIPYTTLTTNLEESDFLMSDRMAFVDTNNNPWAEEWLEETGIARPTGITAESGWCEYPLYEFDFNKLEVMA